MLVGGGYDDSDGWFVEPTVIETSDPDFRTMREELFGPVVTAFVYDEKRYDETLDMIDAGAPYGLTGAVFSRDRAAVELAQERLRYAAGNFYVNDKPTGAVVGQQPFGGARASGTNDKAGSMWNLIRWASPRTIKETFVPPTDYRYPFLQPDELAATSRAPAEAGRPVAVRLAPAVREPRASCHATEKLAPSVRSADGNGRPDEARWLDSRSTIQDVSEIGPAWPSDVADELLNAAVPKSARGNVRTRGGRTATAPRRSTRPTRCRARTAISLRGEGRSGSWRP